MEKINKKGFTLIEVLGVLIILGIIVILAFPSVLNHFQKAEDSLDAEIKNIIIDAAKDYMNSSSSYSIKSGSNVCIKIQNLIEENYLRKDQLSKLDSVDFYVKVLYYNGTISYDVCDTCVVTSQSNLILNGDKFITLELYDVYNELGVNAIDEDGYDLSEYVEKNIYDIDGNKVDEIDTTKIGIYKIKYVLDYLNYNSRVCREVYVVDNIAPVIVTELLDDSLVDTVLTYDLLSKITVSDNSGEEIKPVVKTDLALGVPGVYKITITATDSSGNKAEVEKTLQIYSRS